MCSGDALAEASGQAAGGREDNEQTHLLKGAACTEEVSKLESDLSFFAMYFLSLYSSVGISSYSTVTNAHFSEVKQGLYFPMNSLKYYIRE